MRVKQTTTMPFPPPEVAVKNWSCLFDFSLDPVSSRTAICRDRTGIPGGVVRRVSASQVLGRRGVAFVPPSVAFRRVLRWRRRPLEFVPSENPIFSGPTASSAEPYTRGVVRTAFDDAKKGQESQGRRAAAYALPDARCSSPPTFDRWFGGGMVGLKGNKQHLVSQADSKAGSGVSRCIDVGSGF
ncbi:hypothetical protein LZ31DRAFT_259419 [Colletotrichum somersetense]|nr:hypothetical protein LZ31DRAFT_259419 [Colletotrichum somersetense]